MKDTTIKARWAGKLMRSDNFVVITDDESVIFAKHTDAKNFEDYIQAHAQLSALRKFQSAITTVTKKFDRIVSETFDKPSKKKPTTGRKINVKVIE